MITQKSLIMDNFKLYAKTITGEKQLGMSDILKNAALGFSFGVAAVAGVFNVSPPSSPTLTIANYAPPINVNNQTEKKHSTKTTGLNTLVINTAENNTPTLILTKTTSLLGEIVMEDEKRQDPLRDLYQLSQELFGGSRDFTIEEAQNHTKMLDDLSEVEEKLFFL